VTPPPATGSRDDGAQADAYARAGVDLAARNDLVARIREAAARASRPDVLSGVGAFAGLLKLGGYREPVLAASTDGVGTKLRLAAIMDRYDTVGEDLVNHCVNDVFTSGAAPLFFLDYIGSSGLDDEQKLRLVEGMARACAAHDCALIGGETADMPGIYAAGDFDLVGFMVGAVERDAVIDGSRISAGDALIALASDGLHTNGYSLVRRVFGIGVGGDTAADRAVLEEWHEELDTTLGDALLAVHRSYFHALTPALSRLRGIAHITGGGLIDNVPRVLPAGLGARIDRASWEVPALFRLIQRRGELSDAEMFHAFNMGLGVVVAVAPEDVEAVLSDVAAAFIAGEVVEAGAGPRVTID
jgi:phosphoribosylformylglycinamidine cyclo-ligase